MSSIIESDVATAGPVQGSGLTREQLKNLTLASLGSMLEFYEFMVFGFLTVVIARQFFPPSMPDPVKTFQAFAIFTLGFLLRPLSGAVLGQLGDRLGRKKLFLFTVFAMAVPTILIGLLPSYAQIGVAAPIILLILRMAQGIAIAGEFAGAAVFVSEHVPGDRVGHALGWMMGGSYRRSMHGDGASHSSSGAYSASLRCTCAVRSTKRLCSGKSCCARAPPGHSRSAMSCATTSSRRCSSPAVARISASWC